MRELISATQIKQRIADLGKEIEHIFADVQEPIIFVSVLKGSAIFYADLVRHVNKDIEFDFIQISSYEGTDTTATIKLSKDLQHNICDRHVVVVEDIVDSGLSLKYLRDLLGARKPKSLRCCAMLDKPSRRIVPVKADLVGFAIDDLFVVGYGLDYNQRYRNLDGIFVLE